MQLITTLVVEGFRSLVESKLEPLGNVNCLVGANNSGKSNVLRALNLFFTGESEPGIGFNNTTDYHADPKSRKKKEVRITAAFHLPRYFSFREELKHIEKTLGRDFTLRKTWALNQPEPKTEYLSSDGFTTIATATVKQFTDLINFRYIHNRTVPAAALRDESSAFQAHLRRRLRFGLKGVDPSDLLSEIQQRASEVIGEASRSLTASTNSMRSLEMRTSQEIGALAQVYGFRAEIDTGGKIPDTSWGSGTQAYMMFHLLKMVDTDFRSHFGWRQAAIWAIEEPESSLHRDLEQRLATDIRSWGDSEKQRMQILTTTHSEVFATVASEAFLVNFSQGRTTVNHEEIPILVEKAAAMGISGPVEPVLCYLLDPVVLVEGPINKMVLEHVSRTTGVASNCRFVALDELDPTGSGGADEMLKYIKRRSRLIHNRPDHAPFIVLFDWDVPAEKIRKAQADYGEGGHLRVSTMNPDYADPTISPGVKGIERFYPRELYILARKRNLADVAMDQNNAISIEKDKQKRSKSALARIACDVATPQVHRALENVLRDVETISKTILGQQLGLRGSS